MQNTRGQEAISCTEVIISA